MLQLNLLRRQSKGKKFCNVATRGNVMKFLRPKYKYVPNKLEFLSRLSYVSVRPRAYPSTKHVNGATLRYALALLKTLN